MNDEDRTYLQTPEQWRRFLSSFVHELRTPIASLRMLTDLLAEAPQSRLGDPERRYSESIREVAQDLQALIGGVSDLARLLAGRALIRPEEVVLEQLVDQVEEAVRPQAWEHGIALASSLDPALSRGFRIDSDRLRQALILLLGAAVGHARSEVSFRLDADDGHLRVLISSDGQPFEEAALAALFEPFDHGRSLALPLTNELARALGGTLRACNRGGRPTFDLSLPAAGS
jgi:signal transduction histidine kinase